jgi:hypothetical protein
MLRIILCLLVLGCTRSASYLYLHPEPNMHEVTTKLREVTGNSNIDMFWAIGGMTEQAVNFNQGISQFMTTFTTKKYSWRMAVVASNIIDRPYIGMPVIFDNNSSAPIPTFATAVSDALNGRDDEQIFDPVVYFLTRFPQFIRPTSTLVIIISNDAHDSSRDYTTATQLLTFLKGLKGGDQTKVLVYGIFGSIDLNCRLSDIDETWNFYGSEFDKLIKTTGGTVYSLCDTTFGASLAKIGDDLYKRLDHPRIILARRPDPASIHVFFHGKELPGGPQANGGFWFYDVDNNSVVFYNLDFATLDTEEVVVKFAEDSGTT